MPLKIGVAASGGLDSTYVAWKLLTTTTDTIELINFDDSLLTEEMIESRGDYPNPKINSVNYISNIKKNLIQIRNWLTINVRPVALVTHRINTWKPDEDLMVRYIRAVPNLVDTRDYDKISFGFGVRWTDFPSVDPEDRGKIYQIYRNALGAYQTKFDVPLYNDNINTFQIISEMPSELYNITFSCPTPNYDVDGSATACGVCKKCTFKNMVKEKVIQNDIVSADFPNWLAAHQNIQTWATNLDRARRTYKKPGNIWDV